MTYNIICLIIKIVLDSFTFSVPVDCNGEDEIIFMGCRLLLNRL